MDLLYNSVCPRCGGTNRHSIPYKKGNIPPLILTNDIPQGYGKEVERVVQGIYNGTIKVGSIDPELTHLVAEYLRKAVIKGFGKDFPQLDTGTPHYTMLKNLERNVYQFSAAKNYQQLKNITLALKDENGRLRKFAAFRQEAINISGVYLGPWLRTEYDTAIGSAQMAGKWVDFKAKGNNTSLTYSTAGDSRVREEHETLDGITLAIDHSFWDEFYPPNGFNCRCDVYETHNPITEIEKISLPVIPSMFRVNLGKRELAFPPKHPYYDGVPESILNQVLTLIPGNR